MKTSRFLVFFIILLLVLSSTACERSLTKKSPTATPQGQVQPPGTAGVIDVIYMSATQTALALQGTGGVPVAPTLAPPPETIVPQPPVTEAAPTPQPTVPAAVVVPPPTPGIPKTYTLHKGEFPFCIARRFDVNPSELLNINGLGARSVFYAGMVLKIPQTGHPFPGSRVLRSHPTTYTVQTGDTIYSIACLFGDVSPDGIAAANGLAEPFKIASGQAINIP